MLQGQLPDPRMQRPQFRGIRRRFCPTRHIRGPDKQLLLPVGDLGGTHTELLGQLGAHLVAFDGSQRHLRLEDRSVIPSRSLHPLAPLVCHLTAASVKPGDRLAYCPNFRSPLYVRHQGE